MSPSSGSRAGRDARLSRTRRRWWVAGIAAAPLVVLALAAGVRQMSFFRLQQLEVRGVQHADPARLTHRLALDTTQSVWQSLGRLARRMEQDPMVARAEVRRSLPGTLVVTVWERRPVALVPTPTGLAAVDSTATILAFDPAGTHVDVPVLAGHDTALIAFLADVSRELPDLGSRISDAAAQRRRMIGTEADHREWVLRLSSGLRLRLPTDSTLSRLAALPAVEADLAGRARTPQELDFRFREQVVARFTRDADANTP